jgi:hypothetical protein
MSRELAGLARFGFGRITATGGACDGNRSLATFGATRAHPLLDARHRSAKPWHWVRLVGHRQGFEERRGRRTPQLSGAFVHDGEHFRRQRNFEDETRRGHPPWSHRTGPMSREDHAGHRGYGMQAV